MNHSNGLSRNDLSVMTQISGFVLVLSPNFWLLLTHGYYPSSISLSAIKLLPVREHGKGILAFLALDVLNIEKSFNSITAMMHVSQR